MQSVLLPGQPLPVQATPQTKAGRGAYRRGTHVLASTVGHLDGSGATAGVAAAAKGKGSSAAHLVVPQPGAAVLGRVTRVTQRQANVSILVVDGQPCAPGDWSACGYTNQAAGEDPTGADFTGVIRVQDVRATEKDKVRLAECFRPGDIVRASVISLGDARSYFLSTAANHLGVVYALPSPSAGSLYSHGGGGSVEPLVPISWQEMRDPVTGSTEKRKVAKPDTA